MGVYDPLTHYLKALSNDSWDASFSEIERILRRSLPPSAYDYRPWWGNSKGGNHSQARAWQDAGWETRDIDLKRGRVRFERRSKSSKPATSLSQSCNTPESNDELLRKAMRVSGIDDREKVIEAALVALIQREAAKALIALGGSDPEAFAAPRERPF